MAHLHQLSRPYALAQPVGWQPAHTTYLRAFGSASAPLLARWDPDCFHGLYAGTALEAVPHLRSGGHASGFDQRARKRERPDLDAGRQVVGFWPHALVAICQLLGVGHRDAGSENSSNHSPARVARSL